MRAGGSHGCAADRAARQAAVDRERAATLETLEDLLRAVSGVLDIRQVFPRISEIAARMLPHDRLTMSFHDRDGNIVIEAASNDDGPVFDRVARVDPAVLVDGSFKIVDDFAAEETELLTNPADFRSRVLDAGYRSMLGVHLSARDQGLGVQFWSKQPKAFAPGDVPVARRIADHIALAVSHEQLAEAAQQVAEVRARAQRLEVRVKSLSEELDSRTGYVRVVGQSAEWKAVLKRATQVADTETTVLLTGESGTGKEVVARFVYRASARRQGPFVALNCAALPEQLLESELFGYERGAFTGALAAKPGQIELAAGGVLLLDEVAEMSPSAQAKFLRVLQEREYQRLGGTRVQKANVRIIAATNRDLRKAMERGDFREDLYYFTVLGAIPATGRLFGAGDSDRPGASPLAVLAHRFWPRLVPQRIAASVSGTLGSVGLLLAAIGIYGVTAYTVARRTREIGIRIALGAARGDIVGLTIRHGMSLAAIGSLIGLALAAAMSQVLSGYLFGVPPIDPTTFAGTAVLFGVVGLTACYLPARRATTIDPLVALRDE